MDFFLHPNSVCETEAIGGGTRIWGFTRIMRDVEIGKNCNICDFVFIESGVKIGDNVTIKSGVFLWSGILIENNVFVGPNATFTNDKFPRSQQYLTEYPKTILRSGCSIGANATILPGIEIGVNAMVGAGAVVTKNVESDWLVFGNPAKKIRKL